MREQFWIIITSAATGAIVVIAAIAAIAAYFFGAVAFVSDVPTAAIKVVTSLIILTLLIERGLAILNTALYGKEKREQEDALRMVEVGLELGEIQCKTAHDKVKCIRNKLREIADKEENVRIYIAIPVALFLSAVGVRTLSELMMIDVAMTCQKYALRTADIVLTTGLIAGGSNGLAQLLQIIKDAVKPPPKFP